MDWIEKRVPASPAVAASIGGGNGDAQLIGIHASQRRDIICHFALPGEGRTSVTISSSNALLSSDTLWLRGD